MLPVVAMSLGGLLMPSLITPNMERFAVSQSHLGGHMTNPSSVVPELWKDLDAAKNKGEIIHALRRAMSSYGLHSNMPKELYEKLEAATTHFYR